MRICESKSYTFFAVYLTFSCNFRSQLPARATRLLNRRLQNSSNSPQPSQNGSDSPRSMDSHQNRTTTPQKTSLREHLKQRQQLNLQLLNSSSEDLVMDKTLRNSMLQDVASFKKQLIHLRRVLQEVSVMMMLRFQLIYFFFVKIIFLCC